MALRLWPPQRAEMPQLAQRETHCTQVQGCTPAPAKRQLLHAFADMLRPRIWQGSEWRRLRKLVATADG